MSQTSQIEVINAERKCACGCGKNTAPLKWNDKRHGYIKGEPRKFIIGHSGRLGPKEYIINEKGCWIWKLGKSPNGYGHISIKGKRSGGNAHKFYYEMYKSTVPKGFVVDHLCRTKACVNPEHLEAVPQSENVRRGNLVKITISIAEAIRKSKASREYLAKKYNITSSNVTYIINRKTWV